MGFGKHCSYDDKRFVNFAVRQYHIGYLKGIIGERVKEALPKLTVLHDGKH